MPTFFFFFHENYVCPFCHSEVQRPSPYAKFHSEIFKASEANNKRMCKHAAKYDFLNIGRDKTASQDILSVPGYVTYTRSSWYDKCYVCKSTY